MRSKTIGPVAALALAVALAPAFLGDRAAAQDNEQAYAWVLPGDVERCLGGRPTSAECRRVRWTFYIWPNLVRELGGALEGNFDPNPGRPGRGDPSPQPSKEWGLASVAVPGGGLGLPGPDDDVDDFGPLGPWIRESLILNQALSEALIQPGAVQALQKTAFEQKATAADMRVFRDALARTLEAVEADIEALEGGRAAGRMRER